MPGHWVVRVSDFPWGPDGDRGSEAHLVKAVGFRGRYRRDPVLSVVGDEGNGLPWAQECFRLARKDEIPQPRVESDSLLGLRLRGDTVHVQEGGPLEINATGYKFVSLPRTVYESLVAKHNAWPDLVKRVQEAEQLRGEVKALTRTLELREGPRLLPGRECSTSRQIPREATAMIMASLAALLAFVALVVGCGAVWLLR